MSTQHITGQTPESIIDSVDAMITNNYMTPTERDNLRAIRDLAKAQQAQLYEASRQVDIAWTVVRDHAADLQKVADGELSLMDCRIRVFKDSTNKKYFLRAVNRWLAICEQWQIATGQVKEKEKEIDGLKADAEFYRGCFKNERSIRRDLENSIRKAFDVAGPNVIGQGYDLLCACTVAAGEILGSRTMMKAGYCMMDQMDLGRFICNEISRAAIMKNATEKEQKQS